MLTNVAAIIISFTIFWEAGGEPYDGKLAVASVIYNRAISNDVDLHSVCWQPLQFSCWNGKRNVIPKEIPEDDENWEECLNIALSMCDGSFSPTGDWNHFYNPQKIKPYWKNKLSNKKKFGRHVFGRI